jgi:hypothetical protein
MSYGGRAGCGKETVWRCSSFFFVSCLVRAVDDGAGVVSEADVGDTVFFAVQGWVNGFAVVGVVEPDLIVVPAGNKEVLGAMEGQRINALLALLQSISGVVAMMIMC